MQNFTDAVYEAIGAQPIDNPDDVVARIRNLVDAVTQHPHEIAQLAALKDRETDMAIERHAQNMRVLAEKLRVSATPAAVMRRVTQLAQIEAQLRAEFDIDAQLTPEAVAFGIAQLRESAGEAQALAQICATLGLRDDTDAQDVAQHARGIMCKLRDLTQETARQAQQLARIDQELRKARNDCAAAEQQLARYRGGAQ